MFRKKTVEEREDLRAAEIADRIDRLEAVASITDQFNKMIRDLEEEAAVARKEMVAAARVQYKIAELIG